MDSSHAQPFASLAYVHRSQGDTAGYDRLIAQATLRSDAEAWVFKDLGDIHAQRQDWQAAASAYERALQLGGDSAQILQIINSRPELKAAAESGLLQ